MTQADQLYQEGLQWFQRNDVQAAIAVWQEALKQYRQQRNQRGELTVLDALGLANRRKGDYEAAIALLQQQLALAERLQDQISAANALGSLGNTYRVIGDYAKALTTHKRGLQLRRKLADRKGEGQVLASLGNIQTDLGNYKEASELHQQSLQIARELNNVNGIMLSLNALGVIAANQGNYDQAQDFYQQSLTVANQVNVPFAIGQANMNLGSIAQVKTDYKAAIDYYQTALEIAQAIKDLRMETVAVGAIGLGYMSQQNYATAIEYQRRSLQLVQQVGDRNLERMLLGNLSYSLWKSGQLAEAEQHLRAAIAILESLRTGLDDANKVSIFDTQTGPYNTLQQVLIAQNRPQDALETAERGRARAFAELLAQKVSQSSRSTALPTIPLPAIADIQQVARDQNATLVTYAIVSDDSFLRQGKLQGKATDLYIWVVQPPGHVHFQRVDLRPLPQGLDELVQLSRVAAVQGRGVRSASSGSEFDFNTDAATQQFPNATGFDPRQNKSLRQAYATLIQPIAHLLPTDPQQRVIFVPHQSLFLVPFPALINAEGKYLIEQHTLITAPSIQVLQLTHKRQQQLQASRGNANNSSPAPLGQGQDQLIVGVPRHAPRALVIGNPVMPRLPGASQPLAPLPGAEAEAQDIATLLQTQALIGQAATKTAVMQRLTEARLIHLATHGEADDKNGMESWIALAPSTGQSPNDAASNDGFLKAKEIINLSLKADLVVLSACETGRGAITGDGVIGLSRSFVSAGVPSVVVSLWQVPDTSTKALMTAFYRNLLDQRMDKAQALRQAMLSTMNQFPQPVDWAAFTLIGEAE